MAAEMPRPLACEICGGPVRGKGTTTTALMDQQDGTLRAWRRHIWSCQSCGHRIAEGPYADAQHYAALGAETTWSKDSARGLVKALRHELPPQAKILDIGCNNGDLLRSCFSEHQLFGVEPNRGAAAVASLGGVVILAPTLEDLDLEPHRKTFDAIFAFDLIEHLPDASFMLCACQALLKPGGLLVMETGCADALVPRLEGKRWYYLRFFEHVRSFSRKSMMLALRRAGFQPPCIRLQSHSGSRFGHYGKRGALGLIANVLGLNKPSPDRDGPVFFPFLDHMLVLARTAVDT